MKIPIEVKEYMGLIQAKAELDLMKADDHIDYRVCSL